MPISTVGILKYVQQCYVKWFWAISSLGAPDFLHLETHESQTCLTLAKNSFNGGTQPDSCTKI